MVDTASLIERRRQILLNTPHLTTESANPLTFQTDISANLKDCRIYFEPVQEGSGDPSPENVRPISGWDGVEISISGRNLIHSGIEWFPTKIKPASGKIQGSAYNSFYFPVPKGILHFYKIGTQFAYGCFTDEPPTIGTSCYGQLGLTNYNDRTFDNSAGHKYIVLFGPTGTISETVYDFCVRNKAYVGIETWSTSQPYPPDVPASSLTIPFPQTIYGGYVDLMKGEVVEEWKFITLNGDGNWSFSSSWSNDSVYCVYDNNSYNDALFSDYNGIYTMCDQLISGSRNACYSGALKTLECISFSGISTAPKLTIKLSKSRVSSVDDVKAYLVEHTPMVAYKLATPITHQLTPQTIKTLKGINNIWSDANGNIELRFWKH